MMGATKDEPPGPGLSRYAWAYAYVRAYEDEQWGYAAAGHWDRLDTIAREFERREYGVHRAAVLLNETLTDMRADTPIEGVQVDADSV